MKKYKNAKILVLVLVTMLLLQAGFVAYSMLGVSIDENQQVQVDDGVKVNESTQVPEVDGISTQPLKDEASTEISQGILDAIKASDPENYTKNVDNYKALLKDLNVHVKFKNEIERLISEGKKLPDILTAYAFLNDKYGKLEDLEKLLSKKSTGAAWKDIFSEYNKDNPEFVPQSFDAKYLEGLLETPGITKDDIMIADRVSQKAKLPFEGIIGKKLTGMSWRAINAGLDILNGQRNILHVPVTREQLKKYVQDNKLTEKQAVEALVLASKLGEPGDSVIDQVKQGLSDEEIYARAYEAKFY